MYPLKNLFTDANQSNKPLDNLYPNDSIVMDVRYKLRAHMKDFLEIPKKIPLSGGMGRPGGAQRNVAENGTRTRWTDLWHLPAVLHYLSQTHHGHEELVEVEERLY